MVKSQKSLSLVQTHNQSSKMKKVTSSHHEQTTSKNRRGHKYFNIIILQEFITHTLSDIDRNTQLTFQDYVYDKHSIFEHRLKDFVLCKDDGNRNLLKLLNVDALRRICTILKLPYSLKTSKKILETIIIQDTADVNKGIFAFTRRSKEETIVHHIGPELVTPIHSTESTDTDPPTPCDKSLCERIINDFVKEIQPDKIEESGCAVCGQLTPLSNLREISDFNEQQLSLLIPNDNHEHPTIKERFRSCDEMQHFPGPVLDYTCSKMCNECSKSLQNDRTPAFALAKGFWIGEIPSVLKELNFIEQLLVAKVRPNNYLVRVKSGRYRMRANAIAYEAPISKVYDILPPHRSELDDVIAFIFSGPSKPTENELHRIPLLVRRRVVQKALDWLKLNHCDYRDLMISQENLNSYSDSEIPVSIEYVSLNTDRNLNPESTSLHEIETELGVTKGPCPFILHGLTGENLMSVSDSKSIKALCLQSLTKGQKVLSIGRSEKPENTFFNPQLYPRMFPWLFPYGYGGLDNDRGIPRTKDISSLHWKRRLLMYHDKRFQKDRSFSLVAFNHEQVRDAVTASSFVTNRHNFNEITDRILNVDPDILNALAIRLSTHERVVPETLEEKLCYDLIHDLDLVGQHVQGSITNKRYMRNEIWSVISHHGAPSWFITFAPPDSKNPICLYYADTDTKFKPIERSEDDRYRLIAENPVASARYFNFMVELFLKHVLGVESDHPGLFGHTTAYYGTVEQQGRLTLHLHLLLWVADMLTPEQIRTRVSDSSSPFRTKMIEYLESCMKGEFLSGSLDAVKQLVNEKEHEVDTRNPLEQLPTAVPVQCNNACGSCNDCKKNLEWWRDFPLINDHIVLKANLHKCSTASCLKGKNKECKARFPREFMSDSTVLPSGSIDIRKHERWINNYAPIMSYVLRCNTDVTSLLSGTAIKAVVLYITDYITKHNLSTSVVFDVILTVFQKNREYLQGNEDQKDKAKKLITQMVNALTSKQEIGSPMASMYILGHPDHYTNCTFVPFNWKSYVSYVNASLSQSDSDHNIDGFDDAQYEFNKQKLLIMKYEDRLVGYNTVLDYVLRPDECNDCTLYDWITQYKKMRTPRNHSLAVFCKNTNMYENQDNESNDYEQDIDEDQIFVNNEHLFNVLDFQPHRLRYQSEHPQSKTHYVQRIPDNKRPLANFMNAFPRADPSDEYYCKSMLTLFKPWREGKHLNQLQQSWSKCFSDTTFSTHAIKLMKNFNIKYECLDSRDDYSSKSKLHEISNVWAPLTEQVLKDFDTENIANDIIPSDDADQCFFLQDYASQFKSRETINDEMRMSQMKHLLEELNWFSPTCIGKHTIDKSIIEHHVRARSHIYWIDLLDRLRKKHNLSKIQPCPSSSPNATFSEHTQADPHLNHVKIIDISDIGIDTMHPGTTLHSTVMQLAQVYHLNDEQSRTYQIIASHVLSRNSPQLRMLVHGMAGTGKSQVIKCVINLFEHIGERHALSVLAPTGSAAALIGGSTYHSFLGINIHSTKSAKNNSTMSIECLQRLKYIRYIILDEVSMVSLQNLCAISHQLQIAKKCNILPFGGVNMIFAGDFGQLEPVKGSSLFSTSYGRHNDLGTRSCEQDCTVGKALWHQVTTVVILKQNMRQRLQSDDDTRLRNALENIRMGTCTDDDLSFLNSITAANTIKPKQFARDQFRYKSIITSRNVKRDLINSWSAIEFSKETGKELYEFYSIDNANSAECTDRVRKKRRVALTEIEKHILWNLPPGKSSSIPGKLTICQGMPVIIKRNEATELCITNGAEGHVYDWHFEIVNNKNTLVTIFVKLFNPPKQIHLPTLPPNVVPVPRRTEQIVCQLPNGQTRTINRSQVCINLNFAMTDYCSQGRTRTLNPVHLNDCKNHQAIYTCLSRSSSAAGTLILDKLPSNKLCLGLSQGMKDEFRALELLNEITTRKLNNTLHPKVRAETRQTLFDEFVKYEEPYIPTNVHKEISWSSMNCFSTQRSHPSRSTHTRKRRHQNETQTPNKQSCIDIDSIHKSRNSKTTTPMHSNIPIGLSWDANNYSCAYDSIIPIMFHAWKNRICFHYDIFRYYKFKMNHHFEHVNEPTTNFELIRDYIRSDLRTFEAAPESLTIFPTGPVSAAAHLIIEFILTLEVPFLTMKALCVNCNTVSFVYHHSSMVLCDTSTWEYRMYEQSLSSNHYLSLNDWINYYFKCTNVSCTKCKCKIRNIHSNYNLTYFPDILACQIFTTHTFINDNLLLKNKDNIVNYILCGIIYHARNHYTALIRDSSQHLWYSDGMYHNGEFQCKGICQHDTNLSTIRGVDGQSVYACIALYIKL